MHFSAAVLLRISAPSNFVGVARQTAWILRGVFPLQLNREAFSLDSISIIKIIFACVALYGVQIAMFPGPTVRVAIQLLLFAAILFFFFSHRDFLMYSSSPEIRIIHILLWYSIICAARGAYEAETYVQWRYLVTVFVPWALLPIFTILGSKPQWASVGIRSVFVWFAPLALIFILQGPGSKLSNLNFFAYIGFILPLLLFLPLLGSRRAIVILGLAATSFLFDLSNRANAGGVLVSVILLIALIFARLQNPLADHIIRFARILLLTLPLVLLALGWGDIFNIFTFIEGGEGAVELSSSIEVRTVDSRTPIYQDAYYHLLKSGDWLFGSSPVVQFETNLAYFDEDYKDGRVGGSESSFLATVTYGGITYIAIIAALFWRVTSLAVYRSKSSTVKILGVYLAFRWLMMFVENPIDMSVYWVYTFLLFGFILSPTIREMTDSELRCLLSNREQKL